MTLKEIRRTKKLVLEMKKKNEIALGFAYEIGAKTYSEEHFKSIRRVIDYLKEMELQVKQLLIEIIREENQYEQSKK